MDTSKNRDHIEEAKVQLQRFVTDDDARILVIRGDYGSGKSYFLREYLKCLPDQAPKWFSYTSAFSVESVKELQEIITSSIEGRNDNKVARGSMQTPAKIDAGLDIIQKAMKPFVGGVNLELSVSSLIWSLAKRSGILLIIDDIDRKPEGMKIEHLVGFVSSLIEHAEGKSKAILVINDEALDDDEKDEWAKLREKFLDHEISFVPNIKSLAHHYIKEENLRGFVAQTFDAIGKPNIRSMLRAERLVKRVVNEFADQAVELSSSELMATVELAALFLHAQRDFTAEDVEEASKQHFWPRDRELTETVQQLHDLIERIDNFYSVEYSRIVLLLFKTGSVEKEMVKTFIEQRDAANEQNIRDEALETFWRVYNSNFLSSKEDFEAAATTLFSDHTERLRAVDVSSVIKTLESCGISSSEYLNGWLAKHKHRSDLDVDQRRFPNLDLKGKFDSHSVVQGPVFEDVIQSFLDGYSKNRHFPESSVLQWLAKQTTQQYKRFLEGSNCPNLLVNLREYMSLSVKHDELNSIQQKIIDALKEVAGDSAYRKSQIFNMMRKDIFEEVDAT